MTWTRRAIALVVATLMAGCTNAPQLVVATASPTASSEVTKPAIASRSPLPPPTYLRWAVDKSGFPDRPYDLDFFYDGTATSFRILDASGQVVLRVPIAGSGVFGPETCVVRARRPSEGSTYVVIDAPTLERFVANASTYRAEADSVDGRTVTVPLSDSACRGS